MSLTQRLALAAVGAVLAAEACRADQGVVSF
jgi:hypothetical protein